MEECKANIQKRIVWLEERIVWIEKHIEVREEEKIKIMIRISEVKVKLT